MSSVFVHISGQWFFIIHTPGRRPPHITGHCVNKVTRGWVGAPNERNPFIINDAVVRFVDRCLSRGLGISPLRTRHRPEFFYSRCWPNIGPIIVFFRAFPKVGTLRFKKRGHSKLYWKSSDEYLSNSNFIRELCVSVGIGLSRVISCLNPVCVIIREKNLGFPIVPSLYLFSI